MIRSLLIANRGEIACRIIRTVRSLGIRTVAVYSDADAKALHVRQADEAVHIGASPARESYLVGEKIIAAATATGAEAIHPGYGFLSENAEFAQAVIDAGLIWVGPKPDSIRAMGLKDAAKALMAEAGVPVTPGYMGGNQEADFLARQAAEIGYPVLIKAVAGGGGKGMRKVEDAADFANSLTSCQREAKASFGNDIVLIEKWIESPRHIEVQIFGDSHGNVVHLFERDCSLQRRHQKVIEEAPAPGMDAETRQAVCAAAVKAAKAVNYENAGTIEFIADASEGLRADRIWFMEMNTRLQVEHPVTEEITGVDLVEWQLRVASGEPIPLKQEELSINGHAIEARLYAEDPAKGFLPSTGRLDHLRLSRLDNQIMPTLNMYFDAGFVGHEAGWDTDIPSLRVESGVEQGDEVSPHYDPMIAKLVVRAADRMTAISELANKCSEAEIWPVRTNASFLSRLLCETSFKTGEMTTAFIGSLGEDILQPTPLSDRNASLGLGLLRDDIEKNTGTSGLNKFRLNSDKKDQGHVFVNDKRYTIAFPEFKLIGPGVDDWVETALVRSENAIILFENGNPHRVSLRPPVSAGSQLNDGAILSPMPGRIIAVDVATGDTVTKGQKLLTLEAMKMEHSLTAPFDGVVAELNAEAGAQVQVEALLARIEVAD